MAALTSALRGGLGFLTRLPVGADDRDWERFRDRPISIVLVGYVVGALLVPVVALPVPPAAAAIAFVVWLYALTGITHLDGVADLGDALAVHGDTAERRRAMTDTVTGVGALLAVGVVLLGLGLGVETLAGLDTGAVGLVVAAEVAAKLAMAVVVSLGTASHEGLGSQLTGRARPRSVVLPGVVALPVALVTWPHPAAGVAVVTGGLSSLAVVAWANARLGGVSGDVIGTANEVGRLVGLYAGVIAWTRW